MILADNIHEVLSGKSDRTFFVKLSFCYAVIGFQRKYDYPSVMLCKHCSLAGSLD